MFWAAEHRSECQSAGSHASAAIRVSWTQLWEETVVSALAFQSQNRLSSLQQRLDTASRGQQLTTADSLQQLLRTAEHWTQPYNSTTTYTHYYDISILWELLQQLWVLTTLDYLSWSIFYNIFIFSNTAVNSNVHKMFIKTSLSFHFIWTIIFVLRTKIWMFPSHN